VVCCAAVANDMILPEVLVEINLCFPVVCGLYHFLRSQLHTCRNLTWLFVKNFSGNFYEYW
jgi:hypothetical protein